MHENQLRSIIEEHGENASKTHVPKKIVVCQLIFKNGTQLSGALHCDGGPQRGFDSEGRWVGSAFHLDAMIPTQGGPKPAVVYFDVEDISILMIVPPAQDEGPRIVRLGD